MSWREKLESGCMESLEFFVDRKFQKQSDLKTKTE